MIMKTFNNKTNTPITVFVLVFILCALVSSCHCRTPTSAADQLRQHHHSDTTSLQHNHDNERDQLARESSAQVNYVQPQLSANPTWFGRILSSEQPELSVVRQRRSATSVEHSSASDNDELYEKLLAYKSNYNEKKESVGESRKLALKRKLHKFIDTIIDDELKASENAQQHQQREQELNAESITSKVGVPMQRRRLMSIPNNIPVSQQQSQNFDLENDKKSMDLRKRLISNSNNNNNNNNINDDISSNTSDNLLTDNIQRSSNLVAQPQSKQQQVNPSDHARRILDDKFGIMKESIFTTNNHLGNKGVPKFGSDEDF